MKRSLRQRRDSLLFLAFLVVLSLIKSLLVRLGLRSDYPNLFESIKRFENQQAKFEIEQGVDINASDIDGDTLLHLALRHKNMEMASWLIKKNADVHARTASGITPISLAFSIAVVGREQSKLYKEKYKVIRRLIEKGADVNARDSSGNTFLHRIILLMKGPEPQCPPPSLAKLMIKNGADVNAKGEQGRTPLQIAVAIGTKFEIIQLLIENGADVNATDKKGRTLLHIAIAIGTKFEIIQLLIESGADVNARNKEGRTPLHIAAAIGTKCETIQLLIGNGADINIEDMEGNTPITCAIINYRNPGTPFYRKIIDFLDRKEALFTKREAQAWMNNYRGGKNNLMEIRYRKAVVSIYWVMNERKYENYLQWLPAEILTDTLSLMRPKPVDKISSHDIKSLYPTISTFFKNENSDNSAVAQAAAG